MLATAVYPGEIAITLDDPNVYASPRLAPAERDAAIRKALARYHLQAALFVCGMRVDSADGKTLLEAWDREGHLIGNHTYSHRNLNDPRESASDYKADITKAEAMLQPFRHFERLFRFPFLKEGESRRKRDSVRRFLKREGYSMGYVTVDASDWYIDARLAARLRKDPGTNVKPYRDYYLEHLWDRVQFYDTLAKKVLGRSPKHTLLLHHNLLNALFLGDAIRMLRSHGWKMIDAHDAYQDPIHKSLPDNVPAGESITWALAKASGSCGALLRYPAEDGQYEKAAMDAHGL